jgi:small subunit ribosomal protein S4e
MSHLTRQEIPKEWPLPRKGSVYIVRPNNNLTKGVPLLIILRDILKIGNNRREVKKIIHDKRVLLNERPVKDEKENVLLFDVLKFPLIKKNYKLSISGQGKFLLEEIDEKESEKKISKIIGKKILKDKKTQVNLSDGSNFLFNEKFNINDSVVINLKNRKIEKVLPLKEGAKIKVYSGKHIGKTGKIISINKKMKMVTVSSNNQDINVLIKQIMVIE